MIQSCLFYNKLIYETSTSPPWFSLFDLKFAKSNIFCSSVHIEQDENLVLPTLTNSFF